MKKTVAILLALGALLSCVTFFTGCGNQHEHEFSKWESDETFHWLSCSFDGCTDMQDKGEHSYEEVFICRDENTLEEALEEIHTILDFTFDDKKTTRVLLCSVCGYYKEYPYVCISESEWNAMLASSNFENYTLEAKTHTTITTLTDGSQMIADATNTMRFADGKVHSSLSSVVDDNESTDERVSEGEEATFITTSNASVFASLKYEYFNFNAETNQYVAKQAIEIPVWYIYSGVDGEMDSKVPDTQLWEAVVVEISNGKLKTISFTTTVLSEESGTSMVFETVYTFSDYGTTTISDTGSS